MSPHFDPGLPFLAVISMSTEGCGPAKCKHATDASNSYNPTRIDEIPSNHEAIKRKRFLFKGCNIGIFGRCTSQVAPHKELQSHSADALTESDFIGVMPTETDSGTKVFQCPSAHALTESDLIGVMPSDLDSDTEPRVKALCPFKWVIKRLRRPHRIAVAADEAREVGGTAMLQPERRIESVPKVNTSTNKVGGSSVAKLRWVTKFPFKGTVQHFPGARKITLTEPTLRSVGQRQGCSSFPTETRIMVGPEASSASGGASKKS